MRGWRIGVKLRGEANLADRCQTEGSGGSVSRKNMKINPRHFTGVLIILTLLNLWALRGGLFKDVSFSKTSTQTMYSDSFPEDREYPDLFLRNIVKGRNVKVAREVKTYDAYDTFGRDEEEGNPFNKQYLIENDYTRWFRLYAGKVTVDESLPAGEEVSLKLKGTMEDFTDIGEASDMLRYTFALNKEEVQQASAFWYSWYYNAFSEKIKKEKGKDLMPNIYVNLNGLKEADSFVAVWTEKQDLYFMSEEAYYGLAGVK